MLENTELMHNKICMVTGATGGIGLVTARELARSGAQVIVVSRNPEKVVHTVEELKNETNNLKIHGLSADLSNQIEIHNLANEFVNQFDHLDILVNNAGGFFMKRSESVDGIELTYALNHLNYFLLTLCLIDSITQSDSARIINVSSDAHRSAQINFDDIQMKKGYSGWKAYSQSKLANVLFTYELARRVNSKKITVNALHPGFVASNFAKNNGALVRFSMLLTRPFSKSIDEGARTSIYLATSPEVEGISGMYFSDERPVRSNTASYNESNQHRLWELSLKMTGMESSPI